MKTTIPARIRILKKKAVPILKSEGVKKSHVFGSYARGDFKKKSDIDLLIEYKAPKGLLGWAHLKNALEHSLQRKVDIIPYVNVHPLMVEGINHDKIKIL